MEKPSGVVVFGEGVVGAIDGGDIGVVGVKEAFLFAKGGERIVEAREPIDAHMGVQVSELEARGAKFVYLCLGLSEHLVEGGIALVELEGGIEEVAFGVVESGDGATASNG